MEQQLLLLQHLYGEEVSENEVRRILEDPENQSEYEALKGVKQKLENPALRKSVSVPEDVVRQVFAAARSRSSYTWHEPVRRPRRSVILSGIGAFVTCVVALLVLFLPQGEDPPSEINQIPDTVELQWDDTQERIEMQQALSIVRQRTSPDLWDESQVMKLDSLQNILNTGRLGVETVSTSPQ